MCFSWCKLKVRELHASPPNLSKGFFNQAVVHCNHNCPVEVGLARRQQVPSQQSSTGFSAPNLLRDLFTVPLSCVELHSAIQSFQRPFWPSREISTVNGTISFAFETLSVYMCATLLNCNACYFYNLAS